MNIDSFSLLSFIDAKIKPRIVLKVMLIVQKTKPKHVRAQHDKSQFSSQRKLRIGLLTGR